MGSMIENFDSSARMLLEALLNTLWQGMLIAALVWLLLRLTKRASATTRHAIWLVTLLTIGALPFVAIMSNRNLPAAVPAPPVKQGTAVPVLQTATPVPAIPADPFSYDSGIARFNTPAIPDQPKIGYMGKLTPELTEPRLAQQQPAENRSTELRLAERRLDGVTGTITFKEPYGAPPSVGMSFSNTAPKYSPNASSVLGNETLWRRARSRVANAFGGVAPLALVSLWLAVCALMFWRIARSYRAVFRLRGRLEMVPSEQRRHIERLASLFVIKRPVQAFTSGQIAMPMTVGSLKPVIILPPDLAAGLSQTEFESVVAHELAHIKRWDYLTNMLQRVVQAYLFFHPAIWFIGRQLMIERELACDDWAVKTCEPRRYASCLTKLVEALNGSKPHMAVRIAATGIGGIIFGKNVISRRVEMILNRDRNATTAVSKPALLYAIGLVVTFVAVCSLISPVIAVPLGQKPVKQVKKESKRVAPATAPSQEFPTLPPIPPLPPDELEWVEFPDIPDIPEPPDAPLPPVAALAPDAELAPLPGVGLFGGIKGDLFTPLAPVASLPPGARVAALAPGAPLAAIGWNDLASTEPQVAVVRGQDDRNRQPAIPETELLNLLLDIVKRDADPNVRREALQGIYRLRSDAAINALIQLYDESTDPKVKSEIIAYLLRRETANRQVDNSKAIAKLVAIAKSEQNEELRNRAIRYLGNVKGDEGADTLIQIYDGLQDQKMKQYVIRSLANNKSRKAIDKIIQIAKNDSDPVVRQYAVRSLYGVDNRLYLDFIEKERPRIGRSSQNFYVPMPAPRATPVPRVFEFNGGHFEFDQHKWEEWQKDWQRKWEEQSEKLREMIDRMRVNGLEKLNIEDLQNKLRIEMPMIELQLKELEDKVRLGYGFNRIGSVESRLRSQLSAVEEQLAATRSRYTDTHPKTAEVRNLRNALARQLNSVRSMRAPTPKPAGIRGASATSSATPSASPRRKVARTAAPISF